ncbi:MAG TPA: two-component regulator propeller domain-containing protein [Rhodanobacteraceae bacterium]|nr:two-component regulator propeller domain-containing protein [Rhodanobacteraceae bacterium]
MDGRGPLSRVARAAFCVAALSFAVLARAQPDHAGDAVRFRTYSTPEGLSQATARAIAQDRDGFIWIGTQDGLNRFDGYGFKVYKHDRTDPASLTHNHVWALLADPDGSLWVGTQAGGLNRYDPVLDRFTAYESPVSPDSSASRLVTALARDTDGRIWVANGGGRLQWVDRARERLIDTPLGEHASLRMVRALLPARDGAIWIGTNQGLYRTDADARTMVEFRAGADQSLDVTALAQTPNGELWVGTAESGLYRLTAAGELTSHYRHDAKADVAFDLPDNEVRVLLADADGGLWIGGNSRGLAWLDPHDQHFTVLEHDAARPDTVGASRLSALLRERNGLLLAGTYTNGLSVHDPRTRAFALIDRVAGGGTVSRVQSALALYADADGTLWSGAGSNGGLLHLDLGGQVLRRYAHDAARADSLAHDFVQYITRTRDGSLWIATIGGGLDRMKADGSGFEHLRHDPAVPASLASDRIYYVADDSAGTLWVATADAGLDERCSGCPGFRHHRHDQADPLSAAGDAVSSVRELHNGEFWVAYRSEGLDRFDRRSGRFEHFRASAADPDSLSSDAASVLFEDSRGELWIGTQGGGLVHRAADGTGKGRFETIDSREGLAADAIGAIVETSPAVFWVSTTAGVSRIQRSANGPLRVVNYGARNGAQPRGYWINAGSRLPDGRIVFGGLDGISVLDPKTIRLAPTPAPLVTALLLSNVPVVQRWRDPASPLEASLWRGGKVVLDHTQNNVTFEFGALEYSDPESVQYAYRLDGHDEQWIETSASRRLATYTDLPSGAYHLHVRARHSGENWAENAAGIDIRVLPAPWASPLAYAIYAAALALAAVLSLLAARTVVRRRNAVQEAMRHSAERLKLALWGSGSELWDVDLRDGRMVRENLLPHLAANTEAADQTIAAYTPFVHPDDIAGFNLALRDHLQGRAPTFECSYRTLDVRHEWVWILTRGRAQRDAKGRAVRISGTTHDIAELKRAEEALRALNEELESRVESRTADLRDANLKLRGTLDMLTLAQRHLIETEKLASLGGMVAGIAHEINTPLGISVTAASHLQDEARRLSRQLAAGELTRSGLDQFEQTARESTDIVLRNLRRADRLVKSFKQVAVDQSSEERRIVDLGVSLEDIVTTLGPSLKNSGCNILLDCPQMIIVETAPGALYQIITNLVMNSITHGFAKDRSPSASEAMDGLERPKDRSPSATERSPSALEAMDGREGPSEATDGAAGAAASREAHPESAGAQDKPSEIRIDVRRDAAHIHVDYRDNGRGMEESVRVRIFEPFFTTRRGKGGSGLGMHIVYNLVTQNLRGSIECVSAPGQGALFRIVMPATPS